MYIFDEVYVFVSLVNIYEIFSVQTNGSGPLRCLRINRKASGGTFRLPGGFAVYAVTILLIAVKSALIEARIIS